MPSPADDHLDRDVSAICELMMDMGRRMNHPEVRDQLSKAAGVEMDKVAEIILLTIERFETEIRLSSIANRLGVELSSVSRKVQKMEESGLLGRQGDPDDKRASRIFLTPAGQQALDRFRQARWEMVKSILAPWSEQDRRLFTRLFTQFMNDSAITREDHK